jgi:hypothetical protein
MSESGYEQTFSSLPEHDRFAPETRLSHLEIAPSSESGLSVTVYPLKADIRAVGTEGQKMTRCGPNRGSLDILLKC